MSPAKKHLGGRRSALDMLTRCHQRLDGVLGELAVAIGEENEAVVDESLAFLRGPYRRHVRDEEESVFPRLGPEHTEVVAQLVSEHREHETLIEQLRSAWHLGNISAAGQLARRLRQALGRHSKLEEGRLWKAISALPTTELDAAHTEMRARRGPGRGQGRGQGQGQGAKRRLRSRRGPHSRSTR
jgi:iron-sulfur cluster repair protein YtfE (RIC family)